MQVKTVKAATLQKALEMVRVEVGADAVVLQTRHVRREGLLGLLGGTQVEVTAADGRAVAKARAKKQRARGVAAKPKAASRPVSARPRRAHVDEGGWQDPGAAGALIRQTVAAVREELRPEPEVRVVPPAGDDGRLSAEMREVKALLAKLVHKQASGGGELPEPLAGRYLEMVEQEVAEELAQRLVKQAGEGDGADGEDQEQGLRKALAALLPVAPVAEAVRGASGPRVIALVGPTGVGKTTTLAKLAARYRLREGKRVALATIDTYRIAAVDQLRTYGEILGLDLDVIQRPDQVEGMLARRSEADVVLIDTAGRSPRDAERLAELGRFMALARPDETHLVLSATSSERSMRDANERFSALNPTHVIFTKVDEAICFGGLINVLAALGRPLSYLTTGQEVPHDIEPGSADRLASLVFDPSGGYSKC
ncbi:flagellar biosynthesis protein FlhF [Mucisphaera calidilacus]|uniref:Flagellar biosynthesis protein FlhF n=1 Tax=Mucisphaera calidilacus TaxID=2527982 RepID=A0A518BYX7_9BACT|nr:flagellar biosynthesis protein FlhF [Mucisphaera calidilacus]QDU72173.1 Flagellar biosynthesis protein FlhF [Mucisphaera calidilacus]